jgi:pimeloyl-ACP methyl ester carboxylesterase
MISTTHNEFAMSKGLFLPGLCCRSNIWEHAIEHLPGVDVVAMEWPWPERIHSYDDGAEWIASAIRTHRPGFVVAHSLAGVFALHLYGSVNRPRDARLVVIDTFLVTPHPFFRNHTFCADEALRERIATMLAEEQSRWPILREIARSDEPRDWYARALASEADYIYGARSGEYSARVIGEMAGLSPTVEREIRAVPRTSHFLMLERPDAFYSTLRNILDLSHPHS